MRIKYIILILTFALLVPLFFLGFFVNHEGYKDILYIAPNTNHTSDTSIEEVEKINEEDFLTTYRVEQEKKIKAIHGNYIVNLYGTNYVYPFVLNYNLINGGFFTKSAQEQKHKVVVLNEIAAFELFGGSDCVGNEITMDGAIYTVVGILDDHDEKTKNIYAPITLLQQSPNEYIARLSTDISEEYVKAQYKKLGINTDNYNFINLNSLSQMIEERAIVSCMLISIMLLTLLIRVCIHRFFCQDKSLHKLLRENYPKELFKKETKSLGLFIGNTTLIIVLGYFIGLQVKYIFELLLKWGDINTFTMENINGSFMNNFHFIKMSLLYCNIFFVSFLIFLAFTTLSFVVAKD